MNDKRISPSSFVSSSSSSTSSSSRLSSLASSPSSSSSVSSYFRSRTVSKRWHASLFAPSFFEIRTQVHHKEAWMFILSYRHCRNWSYAYDPTFDTWHKVPLSFLPPDFMYPTAAAGGLICIRAYVDGDQVLSVCNPLLKYWRELPPWQEDRIDPVIGIDVNPITKEYRIIAVGSYESGAMTEVFDSRCNRWTATGSLPRKMSFARSAFCNGLFYCMTAGPPDALLAYNIDQGMWRVVPVSRPSFLWYGDLVEHFGRLLLVGALHVKKTPRVLMCDLGNHPPTWRWLPNSPTCTDWSEVSIWGFAIDPCLSASV